MKIELKYAVIFVVLSFVWNCIEFITGLQKEYINLHPYFVTSFFFLLTAVVYYWALREKRAKQYGRITAIEALLTGLLMTLFILILNPIFLHIFYTYINPDFFNAFILHDVQTGSRTLTDARDYYNLANFIIRGSIYRFIMGILATVLIYVFIKKGN